MDNRFCLKLHPEIITIVRPVSGVVGALRLWKCHGSTLLQTFYKNITEPAKPNSAITFTGLTLPRVDNKFLQVRLSRASAQLFLEVILRYVLNGFIRLSQTARPYLTHEYHLKKQYLE